MAKHEGSITAASLYEDMECHFALLCSTDRYNGQYADEFSVLESILAEEFLEEEGSLLGSQSFDNIATLDADEVQGESLLFWSLEEIVYLF